MVRLNGWARGFVREERGSVAIMFGLSILTLLFIIGMSMDYGRAVMVSNSVASSLDAATLAAGKAMKEKNLSSSATITLAQEFFDQNIAKSPARFYHVEPLSVTLDQTAGTVHAVATGYVETNFTRIGGIDKIAFTKTSTATFGIKDVELGLMLDITGSMCNPCSKIAALKSAVGKLVDIMLPAGGGNGGKVRIGLAPFSTAVNAGPYASYVSGGRSKDGCVIERITSANRLSDVAPAGADLMGVKADITGNASFAAFVSPDYGCPAAVIQPLTDNASLLKSTVNSYNAVGGTAGHLGVSWAWYLLSPNWSGVWPSASAPVAYNDGKTIKVAVLMTDGIFNTAYAQPGSLEIGQFGSSTAPADMAKAMCDNMKANGIQVYTIGFDLSGIPGGLAVAGPLLSYCASDANHYLLANNDAELSAAFTSIASQLNNLRLAK